MNTNLTEIVFVLDRSGSMAAIATEAIGGFNGFVDAQRKAPGEAKLSLVLFDNEYTPVHNSVKLADVPPLTPTTYVPRGMTALYDAVCRTIVDVGKRLATTAESDRPGKVIVAILTDGEENASKEFKLQQVSEMIAHQTRKYNWNFLFLGANIDAAAVGASLSIPVANTVQFEATQKGVESVYRTMGVNVTNMRSGA